MLVQPSSSSCTSRDTTSSGKTLVLPLICRRSKLPAKQCHKHASNRNNHITHANASPAQHDTSRPTPDAPSALLSDKSIASRAVSLRNAPSSLVKCSSLHTSRFGGVDIKDGIEDDETKDDIKDDKTYFGGSTTILSPVFFKLTLFTPLPTTFSNLAAPDVPSAPL